MKLSLGLAMLLLCAGALAALPNKIPTAPDEEQALLEADRAAFPSEDSTIKLDDDLLDPDFTWTDSSGNTLYKAGFDQTFRSGKELPLEARIAASGAAAAPRASTTTARVYGQIGVVQENSGKVYVLRIWIKRDASWRLLIYQAVSTGAQPTAESVHNTCENPCHTVPFQPQNQDERAVIRAYQDVERAVEARDSAAWAAHIADEFFAVTSNSDRPLDKATRMAGLDHQKVGGIAPFPLVAARMFEFADAMVMTSVQQPQGGGSALRVTRVWFERNGAWLEAYSYQTTIRAAISIR
jgi:uncharacterized protein DUF4440